MADDQDKSQQTEDPTAKRLEQAHEHGDTVKSSELSTFILLGGGTLAIAMFWDSRSWWASWLVGLLSRRCLACSRFSREASWIAGPDVLSEGGFIRGGTGQGVGGASAMGGVGRAGSGAHHRRISRRGARRSQAGVGGKPAGPATICANSRSKPGF